MTEQERLRRRANRENAGWVIRLRKKLGMSQRAFAEAMWVTSAAVAQWETGKNKPDFRLIEQVFGEVRE